MKIKTKIESKRSSKNIIWKSLIFLKDIVWSFSEWFQERFVRERNGEYDHNYKERLLIKKCYFAYSADPKIRFSASSGGFCKSFLMYLIENKIVDKAIITRMPENSFSAETIITDKRDEITSSATNSIYAPTNPLDVLNKLKSSEKYVFIGLPCQCKVIKQLQNQGKYKNIEIIINLFCNQSPKIEYTYRLLDKIKVAKDDVKRIEYRGNGWPGYFTAYLKNGDKKQIIQNEAWSYAKDYFVEVCKHCNLLPVYADFSVGDPWGSGFNYNKDGSGLSVVICSNANAQKIIKNAQKKKYIHLHRCSDWKMINIFPRFLKEKLNRT